MKLTDSQYANIICRLEDHERAVEIFVGADHTGKERAAQRASTIGFVNGLMDGLLMLEVDAADINRISPHMLNVVNSVGHM